MDDRINYLIDNEDNGVQLMDPHGKPLQLDDNTEWGGVHYLKLL